MTALLTLEQAAERLSRRPRRLREFLRAHPLGLDGRALYRQDGRDKLFAEGDIARISELMLHLTEQGLPCRSSSGRRAPAKRRTIPSSGPTSASTLRRALALAGNLSPISSGGEKSKKSNVVQLPGQASPRSRTLLSTT